MSENLVRLEKRVEKLTFLQGMWEKTTLVAQAGKMMLVLLEKMEGENLENLVWQERWRRANLARLVKKEKEKLVSLRVRWEGTSLVALRQAEKVVLVLQEKIEDLKNLFWQEKLGSEYLTRLVRKEKEILLRVK